MQVTSTANVSTVSTGTTSTDTISGPQQTLTQNNFLQLLVAQMENQDPMNPQSDTEMAVAMAQFTSLQQSTDMSSSLVNVAGQQSGWQHGDFTGGLAKHDQRRRPRVSGAILQTARRKSW